MLSMLFLSSILILSVGAVAVSSSLVNGKSVQGATALSSDGGNYTVGKHQPAKRDIRRSLDVESFRKPEISTMSKISLPIMIKLHPPTARPFRLHANMPMRFGRGDFLDDDKAPETTPNMPQRFGRSGEETQQCADCSSFQETSKLPQRLGRQSLYWSLLGTLANAQILKTSLHW
ncbi:uncharacterized protein V6R79_023791 [Siganus canaliculatus]